MKILIVSYRFPPYNSSGAVRVGKTAKFLTQAGHEIRVLTAGGQPLSPSLPVEIPEANVVRTHWLNVNQIANLFSGGRESVAQKGYREVGQSTILARIATAYKALIHVPDGQIGWFPFALAGGNRLLDRWKPDLIFASGTPFTSLLVGAALSRKHRIPWVAELRDLWSDGPYYSLPEWRRSIDSRLEARCLNSAAALVTVSQPMADQLEKRHRKATCVVLNGFDDSHAPANVAPRDGIVRIAYTGMIYPGRRDPTPLFEALHMLGPQRKRVVVRFFGRYLESARALASKHGVADQVEVSDGVPYQQSMKIQSEADILLLLLWNDPREEGVFTGKLFEYIGARRPILAIGPHSNLACKLIRERRAGITTTEPREIANALLDWIRQKDREGAIPRLDAEVTTGLSREHQTKVLERFMAKVLSNRSQSHDS